MGRCGVVEVRVLGVTDIGALEGPWRDLEQRSACSFFQSWTWVGCLAAERFPNPVMVEATDAGRTVALGLFNLVGRRLFLGEAGSAELDCPYVEQNGILTEAGREEELTERCLRGLVRFRHVVLSGIGEPVVHAVRRAGGLAVVRRSQSSPFVDLAAIRESGGDYIAGRSANTRQQVRRSDRLYAPVALECAATADAAHAMLDEMAVLHQVAWRERGKPGSFADPFFGRFHHALIDRGFPPGQIAIEKFSSNGTVIGILYNFVWRGEMLAYQSGFAFRQGDSHAKPGLTCHHAAIRDALVTGFLRYDFLAGEDRYKRSLGDRCHRQFWMEAGPVWSFRLLVRRFLQPAD
jgi:CelD/BcsL family acetyltransferase involved in cellulose biosynthesis